MFPHSHTHLHSFAPSLFTPHDNRGGAGTLADVAYAYKVACLEEVKAYEALEALE